MSSAIVNVFGNRECLRQLAIGNRQLAMSKGPCSF
jgi:hypothetical protein